jgi:hypothetical protein
MTDANTDGQSAERIATVSIQDFFQRLIAR